LCWQLFLQRPHLFSGRVKFLKEDQMAAIEQTLIQKLQKLPAQQLAEVEDFVEFLAAREARNAAGKRLGESLARLDAANATPLTDEEIEAEIKAARAERHARHA
jgi:hypothetical protein